MIMRLMFAAVLALGAALLCPTLLLSQEPRPAAPAAGSDAAIQALVAEIRELRLSLERSNLLALRFQAALQASQFHADRVRDLSQRLNAVVDESSQLARQQIALSEEIRNAEGTWSSTNATARREAEERLPHLKAALEGLNRQVSDLAARESMLRSDIQRETTQMEDAQRWLQQFGQSLQPSGR